MGFVKEFREFIDRGNVVDLAVAVVIGASFKLVIDSFSVDILGGVLAAIGGEPDLSGLTVSLGDGEIRWGNFVTAILNFLITAFALFLVVKAINTARALRPTPAEQAEATEIDLLREIRDELRNRPT